MKRAIYAAHAGTRPTGPSRVRVLIVMVAVLAILAGAFAELLPFFRPAPDVPYDPYLLFSTG